MSYAPEFAASHLPPSERRSQSRQKIRALAYVKLDEGNGGIILNLSEGGLSVQAVMSLRDQSLPCMRFQLLPSKDWIETAARVVWADASKKVVGLQFAALAEQERSRIREWLSHEFAPDRFRKREHAHPNGDETPEVAPAPSEAKTLAHEPLVPNTVVEPQDRDQPAALPVAPRPSTAPALGAALTFPGAGRVPMSDRVRAWRLKWRSRSLWPRALAARTPRERWALAALVVLLAAASLAAGWATGRGNVYETLQRLRQTASHDDSVAQYAMPAPARPVEPVSALELVDTYNQQAAIPLPAPAIVPDENRHVEPLQKPPVQSRKARLAVRTPVLTAPRQARRAVYAATERQSPPIPIDTLGGRDSAAQLSGFMVSPRLDPPAPQPVPQPKQASSILEAGALIHRVDPVYPALAKDQRVQGTVKLRATIGQDGAVRSVQVVSGSALLTDAAASAVRQWRYGPTLLNGKPIGTTKDIEVQFRLQ